MSSPENSNPTAPKVSNDETNTESTISAHPTLITSEETALSNDSTINATNDAIISGNGEDNRKAELFSQKEHQELAESLIAPKEETLEKTFEKTSEETPEEASKPSVSPDNTGIKKTRPSSFFTTHPVLHTDPQLPASLCSRLFTGMGYAPWIFLSLLLIAQTFFSLDSRALWYSDEVRHANAFMSMLENGKWFVLEMNGQLYPDKPPLYFWFLRGLHYLIPTTGALLYFAAAAISGMLYLWSMLALGRFVGRFDGKMLLASGILLLTTGYVIGTLHYARMDLLFSAFIITSHVAFFIAFSKPRALFLMLFAFMCAAIACLIKGPLGLIFPLLTSIIFLCWRGTPMQFFRLDVLAGLVFALAIIGGWAVGVFMETGGTDFLVNEILNKHIIQRATDTFHHKQPWHYYLLRMPFMLLPWFFLLVCLPWHHLFTKKTVQGIKDSRHPQKEGLAFLWIMTLSPLLLLSALSGKIMIYYLPALPALALLGGKAVLELSPKRAAMFRALLISFMLLTGIACVVASLALFNFIDLSHIKGIPAWTLPMNSWFFLVAAIILIVGFSLWFLLRRSNPEGILIMMALASIAITVPLCRLAAPSLDIVLSPQQQALVMKQYIEQGYEPFNYKIYDGIYSYYAGHVVPSLQSLDQVQELVENKKIILALRRTHWDAWANKPECLTEVHRQWIETKEYIVAVCPALPKKIEPMLPDEAPSPPTTLEEATPNPTGTPATSEKEASVFDNATQPTTFSKEENQDPALDSRANSDSFEKPSLPVNNAIILDSNTPASTENPQDKSLLKTKEPLTIPSSTDIREGIANNNGTSSSATSEETIIPTNLNGTVQRELLTRTNSTSSSTD